MTGKDVQYVVQENGFWYVAGKEKTKNPEPIVSGRGIANGLSDEYNDGWDFGPDTYNPSITSGIPLTQTYGIQEAVDYQVSNVIPLNGNTMAAVIILVSSEYYILSTTVHFRNTTIQPWVDIRSSGRGSGYIASVAGSTFPFFENDDGRIQDLQFEGFGFDPSTTAQNVLLSSSTSPQNADYHFKDCYFSNIGEIDISIYAINQLEITRCFGSLRFSVAHLNGRMNIIDSQLTDLNTIGGGNEIGGDVGGNGLLSIKNCNISFSGSTNAILDCNSTSNSVGFSMVNVILTGNAVNLTGGTCITNSNGPIFLFEMINIITEIGGVTKMLLTDATSVGRYNVPNNYVALGSLFIAPTIATPSLSANPPVSATVYQNTNPYDIEIDLPAYATTSGTAGYVTLAKGATSSPGTIANQYVSGATASGTEEIIRLRVPAGWYYSFTESGVTFSTAVVFAD